MLVLIWILALTDNPQAQAPPGRLVDMGNYHLHYESIGSVSPTVLFFSGSGDPGLIWHRVSSAVAQVARVVLLDEPGSGWSEFGPLNNTLRQQAADWHRLLVAEKIAGPFVLVGHSKGGLVAQAFARQFPQDLVGMVLVDSSHPDFMLRYRQGDGSFQWQPVRTRAKSDELPAITQEPIDPAREEKTFPIHMDVNEMAQGFSPLDQARFEWLFHREGRYPVGLKSYFSEELQWMHDHPLDLGDLPLVVISAAIREYEGDGTFTEQALIDQTNQLQKDLLKLSRRSRQLIAEKSGHRVHLDQPDLVALTIIDLCRSLKP